MFEIQLKEALGRIGKLTINGKELITPNIFPVVHPREQVIAPREMHEQFNVGAIFTNAYIIFQDAELKTKVLQKKLHGYLDFPGIIATDSGAFQHYMYGTDDLNAAEIESFQEQIGSDLGVILDQPVQVDDERNIAREKVRTTLERASTNVARRKTTQTSWYGPVHGSRYQDLLELSAKKISKLDFAVHALGGIVKLLNQYEFPLVSKIILTAKRFMVPDRPVHLFGAGHPMVFALFVALGCDLFDSAAYSLFAKEGRYLTTSGTHHLSDLTEFPCACPVCSTHDPKEIHQAPYQERFELLARHNLHVTMAELREVRESIRSGSLWQLVEIRSRAHPKLLDALRASLQDSSMFTVEEPLFNTKALFYTGPETLQQPHVQRYKHFLKNGYKIHQDVKKIIIIPELDTCALSSPQIQEWQREIRLTLAPKDQEHEVLIIMINPVVGLVPEDLFKMFPLSHNLYPTILDKDQELMIYEELNTFFNRDDVFEKEVAFFIPDTFISELGVETTYLGGEFMEKCIDRVQKLHDKQIIQLLTEIGEVLRFAVD